MIAALDPVAGLRGILTRELLRRQNDAGRVGGFPPVEAIRHGLESLAALAAGIRTTQQSKEPLL